MDFWGKVWIVSPHIDDAMISMWGFILNEDLDIEVINVFTVTNYTIWWILDTKFVTNSRKTEEFKVSEIAWYNYLFLDFVDAIIRIWEKEEDFINSNYDAYSDKVFELVLNMLERIVASKKYDTVFFPLWLWDHVDHILLNKVGLKLKEKWLKVVFYEDVAYEEAVCSVNIEWLDRYLYRFDDLALKLEVIRNYKTQIDDETESLVVKTYKEKKWESFWL